MSSSVVKPRANDDSSRWTLFTLPWLFSMVVHLALTIALAVSWTMQPGDPFSNGEGLQGTLEVRLISSQDESDRQSAGSDNAEGASQFFSDERANAPAAEPLSARGGGEQGGTLASALAEGPPVDFASSLPSRRGAAGLGPAQNVGIAEGTGQLQRVGGAGVTSGTGATRTTVFGLSAVGTKFVYVFDRSGSMDGHSGAPLAAAKGELLSSLSDLGQIHQFQIIFYNEDPHVFEGSRDSRKLIFANEPTKTLARKFVRGVTAQGGTEHLKALELALGMNPDVIFFLTDADEPQLKPRDLARIVRMNHGAAINTVEFGFGPQADSDNFLVRLARQNGGRHVYVDISELPGRMAAPRAVDALR